MRSHNRSRRKPKRFWSSLGTTNSILSVSSVVNWETTVLVRTILSNTPLVQVSRIPSGGCHTLWPPSMSLKVIPKGCSTPSSWWPIDKSLMNSWVSWFGLYRKTMGLFIPLEKEVQRNSENFLRRERTSWSRPSRSFPSSRRPSHHWVTENSVWSSMRFIPPSPENSPKN